MKRVVFILFFVCLAPVFCSAGVADSAKSLLWRISNAEMKRPSYLFGTIHMICPEDYLWTRKMQKSFEAADEICFEMDMDDPQLLLTIAKGMMESNGKELKDYFTAEQFQKIEQFLRDSLNMEPAMFRSMTPPALQTVFASRIVNCSSPLTYEFVMMEEAKNKKKEITGLEEAREQIELLYKMPVDTVINGILEMIENNSDTKAEYQKMVTAYKNQDINLLFEILHESNDIGGVMAMFLDERNEKWIERMIDKMDQQSVFFAVGAGHLPGQNGVINLLRNAGYKVEAIK
jgi:uncharacterized protein YbaP (TraB family)